MQDTAVLAAVKEHRNKSFQKCELAVQKPRCRRDIPEYFQWYHFPPSPSLSTKTNRKMCPGRYLCVCGKKLEWGWRWSKKISVLELPLCLAHSRSSINKGLPNNSSRNPYSAEAGRWGTKCSSPGSLSGSLRGHPKLHTHSFIHS